MKSGHYYFNDGDNGVQDFDPRYTLDNNNPKDFWFYRTIEHVQDYALNVNTDKILKLTKVWINVVVRNGDRPVGVIGTGLDLTDFINSVIVSDQPGVSNLFVDENGAIQAHGEEAFIDFNTISKNNSERKTIFQQLDSQQDVISLRETIARLKSGQEEVEILPVTIDGHDILLGVGALPDIGWYNISLFETTSFSALRQLLPYAILLFVALLLFSVMLMLLLNRLVFKRIYRLDSLMQGFAESGEVVFPTLTSQDEMGHLEYSFQQMANNLREQTNNLEKNVAKKTIELTGKNIQLSSANQLLQRLEARRLSINETTRKYLSEGNLEQSLELLVANAAKFSGALAGRFLHCATDKGEIKITAVSKMCWADLGAEIRDSQAQAAFDEYAQRLLQSGGSLIMGALEKKQTLILDAEQYATRSSIPLPAGHPAIESLLLTPVSISGKMLGVIALVNCPGGFGEEDVTSVEAFAAEAALLVHAETKEIARAAAEEMTRLRSLFLANMSHELRTPLNVIIGMNQLLQGMKNSREQQDYLEKIGFSAQQLLALINDVLDLSKIAVGQDLVLEENVFAPEELIYTTAQILAFRQGDRKVELHVDLSREIPPGLIGDTLRLTQVLNNLLSNALKFTPQGSVTLQVAPLKRTAEQSYLAFTINDTGIGLSEDQLEQIFKPFVQVDSTFTRHHGGSGLGLAISRELCRLMGGDLTVESRLGQGSAFHFELPFKIDPAVAPVMQPLHPGIDLCGMPILLVNSCPVCCNILPQMLEAMQFKVDLVKSSSGALMLLNSAKEQGNPYQLVLLGLSLDDKSGVEFAEQLAKQDFPGMHKILLANPADLAGFAAQSADLALAGVVPTPARPSDLFDTIVTAFGSAIELHDASAELPVHWQQVKVLLVDDNDMGRQIGRAVLENVGIEVTEAESGLEAIDKVEAGDFDLVLMDVQMPGMDGLSATRAIRNLDKEHIDDLPIIAMTAHGLEEHKEESLAAGMNGHLIKPMNIEKLYAELQYWLPQAKQQQVRETAPAELADYSDLAAALPGVDVKAGMRRAVGDRQLYVSLLKKFVDQFADTENELHKELELQQKKAAILRVHTLKGVAGNLGATQLQELAGQLEEQLTKSKTPAALDSMLIEQKNFLTALQNLPELSLASPDSDKPLGTEAELQNILEQMHPFLQGFQAQQAKQVLAQLQGKVWPEKYSNQLAQLEELIDRYQLNPAAELVQLLVGDGGSR
ncbi:MAG: response regulator [Desulfuromusa sp.]|nr:response regulator [Desulfuromusa sp.]